MEPVELWKRADQGETDAHLLQGCAIEYDGPAKVDEYFKPTIKEGSHHGSLEASFRGRLMRGRAIALDGYCGVILQRQRGSECDVWRWNVGSSFNKFTYWNHDVHPTENDAIQRALEWLPLARFLHTPVEEFSFEEEESVRKDNT